MPERGKVEINKIGPYLINKVTEGDCLDLFVAHFLRNINVKG